MALLAPLLADAREIVLIDPAYGKINASAIDQPRLYALVSDPTQGDAFITWENPDSDQTEAVLLTAFVDTGASGFAVSHLNATGELDQPNLALGGTDYLGPFTEIGIGGEELGDVTRPLGIWVRSGALGSSGEISPADFVPFGDFNLWVRRETGTGEYNEFLGADPINLIGMPVIRQRRLLLDPTPLAGLEPMVTELLAPGAPEPDTQATLSLVLRDFIGATPPPGEVLPSHAANPLVRNLTLTEGTASTTGEWLLDTGAGSSFASFAVAKSIGLIPAQYATLAAFMADYDGPTAEIGGIGATQVVPILNVDRISVPTREGATLVWENVDVLIADVAGLDGIFGMNLLVPAVTVDPADPFGSLFDISPGLITTIVIDTTNAADPVMRLATPFVEGTVFAWLGENFSGPERLQPDVGVLGADPDGDGFSNLMEYALGLDPRAASPQSAGPAMTTTTIFGQRYLSLRFERPAGGLIDLDYTVEISNDLASWRRDPAEVVLQSTETLAGRETLTYRTATALGAGSRVFLRLAVGVKP